MREKILLLLYCVYIVFGILLYDMNFCQYIDELYPWLLFLLLIVRKGRISKPFKIWIKIALFYLLYSILIHSNVLNAILFDFMVQIKPYLTFFSIYCLAPRLSERECTFLKKFTLCCVPFLIAVGISRFGGVLGTVNGEVLPGARFSSACISIALSYYLFADKDSYKTMFVCLLISSIGLFRPTSKYILELGAIILVFLTFKHGKFKLWMPIILGIIGYVCYIQIQNDFLLYYTSPDVARGALYVTAYRILIDYFPFGSGLGSFACAASANWYSPIYAKYDIEMVWGLAEGETYFVSDTFYPTLSQFGLVGCVLFILFLKYIYRESVKKLRDMGNNRTHKLVILFIGYILIESASDASFIGNRGVGIMIMLALTICNAERLKCGKS